METEAETKAEAARLEKKKPRQKRLVSSPVGKEEKVPKQEPAKEPKIPKEEKDVRILAKMPNQATLDDEFEPKDERLYNQRHLLDDESDGYEGGISLGSHYKGPNPFAYHEEDEESRREVSGG